MTSIFYTNHGKSTISGTAFSATSHTPNSTFKSIITSLASRNGHLRNCKAASNVATQWGYFARNPFGHIKPEKFLPQDWHHLKPVEIRAILEVVSDLRWRAFYLLAYTTGARFGELRNRTWQDIDFENAIVRIRGKAGTADMPPFPVKDYEARTLLLPRQTIDALRAWQVEAPERVPYVLLTASGRKMVRRQWGLCRADKPGKYNPRTSKYEWGEWENRCMVNNVLRDIKGHIRNSGLELTAPMTIHTLRKSFAQNHADNGTPSSTLKALLGHASITTTEKYYLQRSDDSERAALAPYESLLDGESAVRMLYDANYPPQQTGNPTAEHAGGFEENSPHFLFGIIHL